MNIHGFQVRLSHTDSNKKEQSVEVIVSIHPLQFMNYKITSLPYTQDGMSYWVHIGYTVFDICRHNFIVNGIFFESGVPYVGGRTSLKEALETMVLVVKPIISQLELSPSLGLKIR